MDSKIEKRRGFLINVAFLAAIAVIVFLIFKYAIDWVMPFIIAFIIVSISNPLVRFISKKIKIKKEILSFLVTLILFIVVVGLLFLLIMQVVLWGQRIAADLPAYYSTNIEPVFNSIGEQAMEFIRQLPDDWKDLITSMIDSLETTIDGLINSIARTGGTAAKNFIGKVPSYFIAFLFTVMLSFFVSLQYDKVIATIRGQLSEKTNDVLSNIQGILKGTIWKYAKGMAMIISITFCELFIGFLVIGQPKALYLALLIALLDALPVLGTGSALIPWGVITLLQGDIKKGISILVIYVIITVVRQIIEPKIIGDNLGLNPIVSLVSIYFGYKVFGFAGMIFMPILTQIVLELHKRGILDIIKFSKKSESKSMEEIEPPMLNELDLAGSSNVVPEKDKETAEKK